MKVINPTMRLLQCVPKGYGCDPNETFSHRCCFPKGKCTLKRTKVDKFPFWASFSCGLYGHICKKWWAHTHFGLPNIWVSRVVIVGDFSSFHKNSVCLFLQLFLVSLYWVIQDCLERQSLSLEFQPPMPARSIDIWEVRMAVSIATSATEKYIAQMD